MQRQRQGATSSTSQSPQGADLGTRKPHLLADAAAVNAGDAVLAITVVCDHAASAEHAGTGVALM
jgi:hypothetical protein